MLTSSQPLKEVFFCPEESDFYSHCLETLVLQNCLNSEAIVEFGSGDGSPIIKALLRADFDGTIQGFELNRSAYEVATAQIKQHRLGDKYIIQNRCLFETAKPEAAYLISNPPYLPALDNKLYQPLLHGGVEGITITKKLLSLDYPNVLTLISSYSNPKGLIQYAIATGYSVTNFLILPVPFGYYSSEPKVRHRIQELRQENRAFYSDKTYLLAGVLFTQNSNSVIASSTDLSAELVKLMTSL